MFNILKGEREGFTLVELIVVIVIIGILAVIAIPRYNNYVRDARLTHIKADMTIISRLIEVIKMDNPEGYKEYTGLNATDDDITKLNNAVDEGRAFIEGNFLEEHVGGKEGFNLVKKDFIRRRSKSRLKGTFLVDEDDKLYYISDKLVGENTDSGENENNNNQVPEDIYVAKDSDFAWVTDKYGMSFPGYYTAKNEVGEGYYKYIGNNPVVKIPNTINGHEMTSYYNMFFDYKVYSDYWEDGIGRTMKVVSENPNIISMNDMFRELSTEVLDLSSFNTSNVRSMSSMFYHTYAKDVNLSSFDTSNVKDMSYMFGNSNIEVLDISSFDMSNVENLNSIVLSPKMNICYVRTETELNKVNSTILGDSLTIKIK